MKFQQKLINTEQLPRLFDAFTKSNHRQYGPVEQSGKTLYQPVNEYNQMNSNYLQTVQSIKSVVFPKIEKLFDYRITKEGTKVIDVDVEKFPDRVLWFVHPCDAAAFDVLKAIFSWDVKDKFFTSRWEKITIIGLACSKSDSYCFCTSVNLDPGSTHGSDLFLTPISEHEFLVEIVTDKGNDLLTQNADLFSELSTEIRKEEHLTKIEKKLKPEDIEQRLTKAFESEMWQDQSLRCLGCGACAYVCPTCACFDIQDEGNLYSGSRVRCWDSCGLSLFTLHTSGHNPRSEQHQRWRQRIFHKFSYLPERLKILGCVGCGRCSRACPVDMNIKEHLETISRFETIR